MRKLTWLLICLPINICAQNTIGCQQIINYDKQQFLGGNQTWDFQMDAQGILYCANNDGLLTFNGQYWKLYPISNQTRLRSVLLSSDGRIYAGAQDELGYFFPDQQGRLQYHSLKSLIPESERQFADIWNIVEYNGGFFFRAANKIFLYKDNAIKVFNAPKEWRFMCKTGDGLYAQELGRGLMKLEQDTWKVVCSNFAADDMLITAIPTASHDTLLVTTLKHGIFKLASATLLPQKTVLDAVFAKSRIYNATALDNGQLAIGTTSDGCYIIDTSGRFIQKFSIQEGLQNNNVLRLFSDNNKNLWLGLDNGIDMIRYNTAIKHIYPDNTMPSSYAIRIYDHQLYVGTSNGLFSTPLDAREEDLSYNKGRFTQVTNSQGQIWNLSEVNHHLVMGHHEGTFYIENHVARPVLKDIGSWLYVPLSPVSPSKDVLVGSYDGLHLLQFNDQQLGREFHLDGLYESLRFLTIDNDHTIWASHPYRGVYRIVINPDSTITATLYISKNGLPDDLNNFVFHVKNRMVIATSKGIYEYDKSTDRFHKSPLLQEVFKDRPVNYLTEDANGNIWFVSNKQPGIVDFQKPSGGKSYSMILFPELAGKIVGGFECIYPYNEENVFIGAEKGIYHINYKKYIQGILPLHVLIGNVTATGNTDSLIFGGYFTSNGKISNTQPADQQAHLPSTYNSFHFEYAATTYEQENNLEYAYRLEGFEKDWSEWTHKTQKEYTNLPPGHYTFMVQARNNLGQVSSPAQYSFTIQAPWYRRPGASITYFLLFLALVYLYYRQQKKKFAAQKLRYDREQEHLRYMHQLEMEHNEKELIQLQNEKLETEVHFKNKELANATMHLVERGKVLSRIKEELLASLKKSGIPSSDAQFRRVLRLLEDSENGEEDWQHFSTHFDEVHSNFLSGLKEKFPQLTPNDLKLCAYLRMNLTSKEIAQLLSISVRGVEISRYRLRKKLNLPGEMTLYDFLLGSTKEETANL